MSEISDRLEVSTAGQFKALGHPLRHRLLFALGQEAGMVHVADTRQVRGGTEQYYRRSARKFDFVGEGARANNTVVLQAIAAELETDDADPMVLLRNVRLTADQAAELAATLERMVDDLTDAGPGESRYGVVVSVYHPRQPQPSTGT